MVFSCLLKSYGPNLQNDTKLETTSCFIAEKMALDEPLFLYRKSMGSVLVVWILHKYSLSLVLEW